MKKLFVLLLGLLCVASVQGQSVNKGESGGVGAGGESLTFGTMFPDEYVHAGDDDSLDGTPGGPGQVASWNRDGRTASYIWPVRVNEWAWANLAQNSTNEQGGRGDNLLLTTTTSEVRIPFNGWIVGIDASVLAPITTGSATFSIDTNNVATGLSCIINTTVGTDQYVAQEFVPLRVNAGVLIHGEVTTSAVMVPNGTSEAIMGIWMVWGD